MDSYVNCISLYNWKRTGTYFLTLFRSMKVIKKWYVVNSSGAPLSWGFDTAEEALQYGITNIGGEAAWAASGFSVAQQNFYFPA